MKLADPMQDLYGLDPRARGVGKETIGTPADGSALFAGVMSSVASRSERDDAAVATAETGTPPIDAVEDPDPTSAETTVFGPKSPRTAREGCVVDSQVASKEKAKLQIGIQLSNIAHATSAPTASPGERESGDDDSALGLMNMLLSNSGLSGPPTSRNGTAVRPSILKERADAAIAQPNIPGIIQSDVTTAQATDPAAVLRASDVRGQRKAEGDVPSDLVAMLLSGLGAQSFSTLQASAAGELPRGSEPHTVVAMAHVDAAHVASPQQISLGPSDVGASLSGEIEAAPVATINAVALAVKSVSTHLGATSALAPPAALAPVSATPRPTSEKTSTERVDFAHPIDEAAAQTATERKPEASAPSDRDGYLSGFNAELLESRPATKNDIPPSERKSARSRIAATEESRSDVPVSIDEGVRGENADAPIDRSQKSGSAARADHDPPEEPTAKSVSRPTEPAIGDTPRPGQAASSISRIAAAVTDMAQRSVSSSTNSMASLVSARTLTLRIDQPELGPINIRMHLTGQSLDLHLTVSDHATAALLQRERESLTSALGNNSYRLHSLVIQSDSAVLTTASGHTGTGERGQGARTDSNDSTPQGGNRNNAHAESDRQRRQGDKADPSHAFVRNTRGSLFV